MIAMKKVSVIIPMHNAEKTIKRALDSLMNQSYANIEVVVVNNNSTDKSINIAKTYLNKLELKLLNEKNSGPSYARNNGIENSSGEYIMFLDADDYFEKDMVYEMVSAVKNNDLVCCNKYKVNNQKKTFEKFQNESIKSYGYIGLLEYMQKHAVFNTVWNKIYKKSIIIKNKIRFNTSMKVSEDYNFNIDYYRYVKSAVVINAPLYNYFINKSGVTKSPVTQKDFEYIDSFYNIWKDIEKNYPSIGHYAYLNFIRSNFTILTKMKLFGYDKTDFLLNKRYENLKKIVRNNFWNLLKWKMPISRKLLLIYACV